MKRAEVMLDKFINAVLKLDNAKKNQAGVRLQKTTFVQEIHGEVFTITIERGDKLN